MGTFVEVSPELIRTVLDSAPDAIVVIDNTGTIVFANRQVSALLGYSHDEIIGLSIEELMPGRFRGQHVGHRKHYIDNPRVRSMGAGLALFGQRKDGTEFPVEICLSPIEDGNHFLTAAAVRDATERKHIEAELTVAREVADRANLAKSRFLATASHDLRQPLQTLSLLNGALRRIVTAPDAVDALRQEEQAIGAMSRLLNALLDISKLESGAIKPEMTDFTVAELFRELRSEFANLAANKGLNLQVEECTDYVHSDPSLVEQILRNLVSNAVKYTREGWVRLRCLHEAALVRIEVLDTGIGIPADQIAYIYDEFYQVGVPTNSSRDGYGLGLSIVQRIVKLLDLKLDVRSELGKGSAFCLLIPATNERVAGAHVDSVMPSPLKLRTGGARILLVEDDLGVREATRMLLTVEGYRVTAVASLAEALRVARSGEGIDVLVTDYHLSSGTTGIQVIEVLRKAVQGALRAVLMTGDTSAAIKALPQDPHLRIASKPVNADELTGLLETLLAAGSV